MKSNPGILTTNEAARLCGVSHQTIVRSFDSGVLKGWRIPGSKFRRIPRGSLLEFMAAHGIPLPDGESVPLQSVA